MVGVVGGLPEQRGMDGIVRSRMERCGFVWVGVMSHILIS